jgi:hypothetical protein
MNAQVATKEDLDRPPWLTSNQIVKYPATVRELLLYIVNDLRVRHRAIDGTHMVLYPPDGVSRPFKVAAARQKESQIKYLNEQFLDKYGLARMDAAKEPVKHFTTTRTEPEPVSDSLSPGPVEPEPANPPSEPSGAPEPDSVQPGPVLRPLTPGRTRVLHSRTEVPLMFETDGERYYCIVGGCDYWTDNRRPIGAHTKTHTDSDESKALRAQRSGEARHTNSQLVKAMKSATRELMGALDWSVAEDQSLVIEQLHQELAAAKKEVSDLRAKIDLMKEALGA